MANNLLLGRVIDDPVLLNDWHVVARAADVKPGEVRPVRLLGRDLVLWRNDVGFHAWFDLCIHRGARLSRGQVKDECLVCPYHGWEYDSEGTCVRIPAHPDLKPPDRANAQTYHSQEKHGLVWVCLGTPASGVAPFPEWDDATFRKAPAGPYDLKAHGPRVLENFLDVGHFAFVHTGLLGDPGRPEIQDYEVEMTSDGIICAISPSGNRIRMAPANRPSFIIPTRCTVRSRRRSTSKQTVNVSPCFTRSRRSTKA